MTVDMSKAKPHELLCIIHSDEMATANDIIDAAAEYNKQLPKQKHTRENHKIKPKWR